VAGQHPVHQPQCASIRLELVCAMRCSLRFQPGATALTANDLGRVPAWVLLLANA
jgi:hypothetical protein